MTCLDQRQVRAAGAIAGGSLAWYALKTRARHEKVVARALASKGVEHFLPLQRVRRRWSDRFQLIEVPLFSTYLFVRLHPEQRLQALAVRGAVCLLGSGGTPTPVPDGEIEAVRRLMASGLALDVHTRLRPGQRVRIRSGPLRGIEGTLLRRRGRTQLVVAVDLIGQGAALTIDGLDVEAA
ncbi:MAG: antitermination factor NusG [Planctomycetota bacterium]|nr:MAG: antitermination factor NusG [Planctomycetota bacterium]